MPTPDEPVYATDAETSMRAAAKLVLQGVAAGYTKTEILSSLEREKIFLPDPSGFVDTVSRANSSSNEPADAAEFAKTDSRKLWYLAGGLIAAVALGTVLLLFL